MSEFLELVVCEISGRNLSLLFNRLKAHNVSFKDLYFVDDDKIRITVEKKDLSTLIAITKESWYNKIIGYQGKKSKLKYLLTKIGIILGCLIFVVGCYFCDNIVLGIKINSDDYFLEDVNNVLERENIKRFSKFSSINFKELSDEIYSENPLICYVQAKKRGNTLIIQVEKSYTEYSTLELKKELVCDRDGEVLESIVYRGIAKKDVGESVKKGDVLVTGEVVKDENVFSTYVLARVSVICSFNYTYYCKESNLARDYAIILAKSECGIEDCYSCSAVYNLDKYEIQLKYIKVFAT